MTENKQQRPILIASFSAISAPPPRLIHRSSPITCPSLTSFLFRTNKPNKITIPLRPLLKTKEKHFSIQYKSLRPIRPNYLKIEIPFEVSDAANFVCSSSDPALRSGPERPTTQH